MSRIGFMCPYEWVRTGGAWPSPAAWVILISGSIPAIAASKSSLLGSRTNTNKGDGAVRGAPINPIMNCASLYDDVARLQLNLGRLIKLACGFRRKR